MPNIHIRGEDFVDEHGRVLMLRGVNLAGSSKLPVQPRSATHAPEAFYDYRDVSFVGRPFPLSEADEHFGRLREWGLTFLRLLVTWEAIEHRGPGEYDTEYIEYIEQIVAKAGEYGLRLFIDPHQDMWSRWSGGDGAPAWTLEKVGFDLRNLAPTGAALLHHLHGDPYPPMLWTSNYAKLAAASMFTLFFAGNELAPATLVDGEPAQEYLQRHYIAAIQKLAERLADHAHVVGYDSMNEILEGYIGWRDLEATPVPLALGRSPSPLQAMALGDGIAQEVELWRVGLLGPQRVATQSCDPGGVRAWRDGTACVWRQNGVWDTDAAGQPRLLRPDHFCRVRGRTIDFGRDFFRPFAKRFAEQIRAVHPGALVFVEGDPLKGPPQWQADDAGDIVYAPHWYDTYVLFKRRFNRFVAVDNFARRPVFFPGRIRRSFAAQLAHLKRDAAQRLGGVPIVIGEVGIAFDLDHGRAYRHGDFSAQLAAMDRTLTALDDNLLSFTWWNYTPDNDNARGDQWNGEDLSIFSRDQQHDREQIDSGGRALAALLRPYPRATAGRPLRMAFDRRRRRFELTLRHDPAITAPTEIYVPRYQYPNGYEVELSDGRCEKMPGEQLLLYQHSDSRFTHRLRLRPARSR